MRDAQSMLDQLIAFCGETVEEKDDSSLAWSGPRQFENITIVQFHVQAIGVDLPSQLLSMLPYLATIVVLVLISRDRETIRLHAPASLGMSYHPAA